MKKLVVFSIIILACSTMVQAQKFAEVGLIGATSHYFGDITDQKLNKSLAPLGGLYYLHVIDSRLSLKSSFLIGEVKSSGQFNEKPCSFSSQVAEMALQLQVNYLDYLQNNPATKFSPYLGLGLGFLLFSSNNVGNSTSKVTSTIPLSFGFNYSLSKRWGAGAELNIQKTFSDRLDNMYDPLNIQATDRIHNRDWFGYIGVHLSYLFYLSKKSCSSLESLN